MGGKADVRLDTQRLDKLKKELEPRAQMLINKVTFDVQESAQNNAPVDTGALKNSIKSVIGRLQNMVTVGVEYGIYQEFGTRFMPAHPFLIPALEKHRKPFLEAWRQLVKL